jgi:flagellar biosynthesis/type III secretory pathway protein FliH
MSTHPHDALFRAVFRQPRHLAALLRDARTATRLFASATHWAPRLRALVRAEQASVAAEQPRSYLLSVLDPDDADRLGEVLAELDPTVEEIDMNERETFYEASYRKGHEAGVRYGETRGEARGEANGRAATLLRQLTAKFGAVGPEHRERLERRTIPELDALAERVLTATSLAELFEG